MEQSQREAAQIAEAKRLNSLSDLTDLQLETIDDRQGVSRDQMNESMFGVDDFVVIKNIFDGTVRNGVQMPKLRYSFQYNGATYWTEPGQTAQLPGSRAYLFVKHLVSLIYRRVEGNDNMDKRTYPADDKWVKEIVVSVHETLTPEGSDRNVEHKLPDYIAQDAEVDQSTGLGGRIASALGKTGGGEVELKAQLDDSEMNDSDIDQIADFDPSKNTNVQFDKDGNAIDTSKAATKVTGGDGDGNSDSGAKKETTAFPGAKKNQSTRQAK